MHLAIGVLVIDGDGDDDLVTTLVCRDHQLLSLNATAPLDLLEHLNGVLDKGQDPLDLVSVSILDLICFRQNPGNFSFE